MKKYPVYFLIWIGLNTYLLLSNLTIDHGSINYFYPFFISLKYEIFQVVWSAPSYDFSEYFFYAVVPFLYITYKKNNLSNKEGLSEEVLEVEQNNIEIKTLKWYDKPINVILFSIFIFPLGLFCLYRSKEITKRIKVICLIICAFAAISTIRGVYEDLNEKNELEIPFELQLKIDEINNRKSTMFIEPCLSLECYDNKLTNYQNLINDINSLYYEALQLDVTITKNELIKDIYSEIKKTKSKRKVLFNIEKDEKRRNQLLVQEELKKAKYDSLVTFVSENERVLDNCEYDLDHLSRFDPKPELGIMFTIMMRNIEEKEAEINQYPDLKSRLEYIFLKMRELNRRSY